MDGGPSMAAEAANWFSQKFQLQVSQNKFAPPHSQFAHVEMSSLSHTRAVQIFGKRLSAQGAKMLIIGM